MVQKTGARKWSPFISPFSGAYVMGKETLSVLCMYTRVNKIIASYNLVFTFRLILYVFVLMLFLRIFLDNQMHLASALLKTCNKKHWHIRA